MTNIKTELKLSLLFYHNSYLTHRIIDSFPWMLKLKIDKIKLVLFSPKWPKIWANKISINFFFFIFIFVENFCNSMLYMIFQYGCEPFLIRRFRSRTGNIIRHVLFLLVWYPQNQWRARKFSIGYFSLLKMCTAPVKSVYQWVRGNYTFFILNTLITIYYVYLA